MTRHGAVNAMAVLKKQRMHVAVLDPNSTYLIAAVQQTA